VPLLGDLGVDARGEVTGGDPASYATVRTLQAALEGGERVPSEEGLERYLAMNRVSARKLDLEADLVLAHDVPPASLVEARTGGRWIWRCHFDCAGAQHGAWAFFRPLVERFDAAVFSLPTARRWRRRSATTICVRQPPRPRRSSRSTCAR